MTITIKSRQNNTNLYKSDLDTLRAALEAAVGEGADLRGANLYGAKINWQSHDVLAELLFRAADQDVEKRKVAGLILISRDWCWKRFLSINDPLREWIFETLAPYAANDDNAPSIFREHTTQKQSVEEEAIING